MSWDAVILRIRGPLRPVEQVDADDFLPLGTPDSVASALRAMFPNAVWDSATYVRLALDQHTVMMINLDHLGSSNSIHVKVSGPGNPVPNLLSLANANGWVVLDCSSTRFIAPDGTSSDGFEGYKSM